MGVNDLKPDGCRLHPSAVGQLCEQHSAQSVVTREFLSTSQWIFRVSGLSTFNLNDICGSSDALSTKYLHLLSLNDGERVLTIYKPRLVRWLAAHLKGKVSNFGTLLPA